MRSLRLILLPVLLALAACGSKAPEGMPALPKDLATFTVAPEGALPGRDWDGVVEAVRRADLAAQTAGRVSAVMVDVGDRVRAGDVLLRISAEEQVAGAAAARAQLAAAQAAAVEAEQTYRRYAALIDARYVSKAQLDAARAARDAAQAARKAASAMLAQAEQQAAYTVVRAPFAGVVARREVEPGETVAPGAPLIGLHAPEALRIEVAVPQGSAEAIRRHPAAQVVLADGRRLASERVIVFPAADPQSHSVTVRVDLPALAPLPAPGTTAKLRFADAGDAPAGVRVPLSCIAQRGELSAVYVVQKGRLQLRQLRLGARSGETVEVIAGLRAGERVAVDPVAALQAHVAQRRVMEPGHD